MTVETGQKESLMAKLFKLWSSICELVIGGKRDLEEVIAHLQEIKDDPNFRKQPVVTGPDVKASLRGWAKFYRKFFGITLDTRTIRIPASKEGFGWLIVVAKGLTNNQIYAKLKENFPCWKSYDDLNLVTSDRVNTESYAIWVRGDRVEADEELRSKSAGDLKRGGINCVTLAERLILELCHWSETGKHLDLQNITLCAGSRYSDGLVPRIHWDDDGLGVGWRGSASQNDNLRARQVVS